MEIDDDFSSPFLLAAWLTDPICKAHASFRSAQGVDALHPKASQIANLARKIFLSLACVVFASLALFTTVPGIALRWAAIQCQNKPYLCKKGKGADQGLPENRTFTVLSFNVCCVAGGYPITDGGVTPWEERIDGILAKVCEKNADVNCLYETFDTKAAWSIAEKLKEKGYGHIYYNIGPKPIGVSSGILVASKFEIQNPEFVLFPSDTLVDRTKYAAKGVFGFDLVSQGKPFARLFATHLQHSEKPQFPTKDEVAGRRRQMEVVMEQVNKVRDRCLIVTGDLNLDDAEYAASDWHHRFVKGDVFEGKTWRGDAFCARLTGKEVSGALNLDHTLLVKGTAHSMETDLVDSGFDPELYQSAPISDHNGLYTRVIL